VGIHGSGKGAIDHAVAPYVDTASLTVPGVPGLTNPTRMILFTGCRSAYKMLLPSATANPPWSMQPGQGSPPRQPPGLEYLYSLSLRSGLRKKRCIWGITILGFPVQTKTVNVRTPLVPSPTSTAAIGVHGRTPSGGTTCRILEV
jgi:hypothetical protein